ncbi:MAG: methylmalonyl-CoA epimerase, partial [Bacteroidota bacterium]
EHLGIAVRDPEPVLKLYEALFGFVPYRSEAVEREGVRTHFLDAGTVKLELLESLHEHSPVAKYLAKRGEGIHHLAFEVEDIDAAFAQLGEAGFTLLGDAPKSGADAKRIFFIHPRDTHGVLVELCQQTEQVPPATRVPFAGGSLASYAMGRAEAPALLMLHGGLGSVESELLPVMRELQRQYRVISFDFAGHAGSRDVPATPELRGIAQCEAVLDAHGVDAAHVFGFSMGGTVALHLAHARPDRVRRIAVLGVNSTWDEPTIQRAKQRITPSFIEQHPDWTAHLAALHGPAWPKLALTLSDAIDAYPGRHLTSAQLAALPHPVFVLAGDRDRIYPLEHTLHLYRALPDAQLAILPGAEHALHRLPPRPLADQLHRFYSSTD